MEVLSHYNIRRVIDICGSVQDRDPVGRDVTRIVNSNQKLLRRGSFFRIRGQLQTMRTSYDGLLAGLGFAIILVYFLIVVNFQSWLDPFIIITALAAALAGIIVFLFLSRTTLSAPALMGAIMCMGVATASSILVVAFATERLASSGDPLKAAIEAGFTRFRPALMTALAMIIGMIPHGPRFGGWRRGERTTRPCGGGRFTLCHGRHARFCSHGLCVVAWNACLDGQSATPGNGESPCRKLEWRKSRMTASRPLPGESFSCSAPALSCSGFSSTPESTGAWRQNRTCKKRRNKLPFQT
jgi:AcrB/AcrD/AcrF family